MTKIVLQDCMASSFLYVNAKDSSLKKIQTTNTSKIFLIIFSQGRINKWKIFFAKCVLKSKKKYIKKLDENGNKNSIIKLSTKDRLKRWSNKKLIMNGKEKQAYYTKPYAMN